MFNLLAVDNVSEKTIFMGDVNVSNVFSMSPVFLDLSKRILRDSKQ